jgi:hypothetical protein
VFKQQSPRNRIDKEERNINNDGQSTSYTVDDECIRPPKRKHTETPMRNRTPSSKNVTRGSARKLSVHRKEKLRGNVVSGLIINGSDEENDFFNSSPCVKKKQKKKIGVDERIIPETPLPRTERGCNVSKEEASIYKGRSHTVSAVDDGIIKDVEDIQILNKFDTKSGKCGDKGYRCSKAFCFACVA